jgi:catechol 2,3-dioxygenase-like lactoylglutathione lyase family enzyme
MLKDHIVYPTIPTSDPERLRPFYEETLGLPVEQVTPGGIFYRAGNGTVLAVTRSGGSASGTHTQAGFRVDDIEREVAELRTRGVVFEEYDLPNVSMTDGIARMPAGLAAWFKDPDGNLIAMIELGATEPTA